MRLTPEEKEICRKYFTQDQNGKYHCFICPLRLSDTFPVCKKIVTKEEFEKEWDGKVIGG